MRSMSGVMAATLLVLVLALGFVTPAAAGPGDLDPAFGTGGVTVVEMDATPTVSFDPAKDIALDGQQRIVVAGNVGSRIGLARLTPSGALDAAFGGDGTVVGPVGGVRAATVDTADGVLVAGSAAALSGAGVLRFNADGTLDDGGALDGTPGDAFGTGGGAPAGMTIAAALLVQPSDGGVVVAGSTGGSLVLRRLDATGAPDPSFGTGGTLTIPRPGATQVDVKRVALDASGRILVAIQSYPGPSGGMVAEVLRITSGGVLDPGFGAAGVFAQGDFSGFDVVPQGNRAIVLGSRSGWRTGERLNPDGALDTGFGAGGWLEQLSFMVPLGPGVVTSLRVDWEAGALMPDGHLLTAGTGTLGGGEVGLARFSADGQADTTFGTCGLAHAPAQAPGAKGSGAIRVLAQADGNTVVLVREQTGIPTPARPISFVVARVQGGSGPPTPEVIPATRPATGLTATQATLNGLIDPQGATYLTYGWDLGTDTSYDLPTGGDDDLAPAGVSAVSRTVADLQPATTYHYRLHAYSRCGRWIYGPDMTFTTSASPALVTGGPPTVTAPAPAPAAPAALTLSLRPRPGQSLRSLRAKGLALIVRCARDCSLDGRLLLDRATARRLGLPARSRLVTVGRGTTKAAAGRQTTLTVGLTAPARVRLARATGIRFTLRLVASAGGATAVVQRRVTVSRTSVALGS